MQTLPNQLQSFVDSLGNITKVWSRYLQQFTQAPPNFISIELDGSPFAYTAKEPGYIVVKSGTISQLNLIRGSVTIDLTGQKIVPVSISDTVEVTYSILPTMQFIPIYGANTST